MTDNESQAAQPPQAPRQQPDTATKLIAIRPATLSELETALNDPSALSAAIGSSVPDGWPEKTEMFRYAAERLPDHPEEAAWRIYLFFDEVGNLVGSGGYHGPPFHGNVEIGYEIASAFRGRGLGTAAVDALVVNARDTEVVTTVIAQTLMDPADPSAKLLSGLGFTFVGPVPRPAQGDTVWQWEKDLE